MKAVERTPGHEPAYSDLTEPGDACGLGDGEHGFSAGHFASSHASHRHTHSQPVTIRRIIAALRSLMVASNLETESRPREATIGIATREILQCDLV